MVLKVSNSMVLHTIPQQVSVVEHPACPFSPQGSRKGSMDLLWSASDVCWLERDQHLKRSDELGLMLCASPWRCWLLPRTRLRGLAPRQ